MGSKDTQKPARSNKYKQCRILLGCFKKSNPCWFLGVFGYRQYHKDKFKVFTKFYLNEFMFKHNHREKKRYLANLKNTLSYYLK